MPQVLKILFFTRDKFENRRKKKLSVFLVKKITLSVNWLKRHEKQLITIDEKKNSLIGN